MIRILLGATLAAFYLVIFVISMQITRDFFSPLSFVLGMQFLRYVPTILNTTIGMDFGFAFNNNDIARLVLYQMLATSAVIIGYLYQRSSGELRKINKSEEKRLYPQLLIILVYLIGLYSRYQVIAAKGGIQGLLSTIGQSAFSSSGSGMGSKSFLQNLMTIAICMELSVIGIKKRNGNNRYRGELIALWGMTFVAMMTYLVLGKRSGTISYLLLIVVGWNHLVKRLSLRSLVSFKSVLVASFVAFLIVAAPALRTGSVLQLSLSGVFAQLSFAGRDMATFSYFESHPHWLGLSYVASLVAIIPSTLWSGKPIVDDGIYLRNIIAGYDIQPLRTLSEVPIPNSYPFSSQGALYANFGIVGVIVFEFLLGMMLCHAYYAQENSYNARDLCIYFTMLTGLEFTSIALFQVAYNCIVIASVFFFVNQYMVYREREAAPVKRTSEQAMLL